MPKAMNPHHSVHDISLRSASQRVCIGMGISFIVLGMSGVLIPGLFGMHLSMTHNLIHLVSGVLSLWCGYADWNKAFNFCLGVGAGYGLLGIAGFLVGEPGYPSVGYMQADQNLMRAIPNILEFGSMDHAIHMLISAIFLYTAFIHRKERRPHVEMKRNQSIFERDSVANTDAINRRSTLGSSDLPNQKEKRL